MQKTIPFKQIPQLSKTDVAYATGDAALRPFYSYDVDIQSFKKVIEDKKKDKTDRKLLVEVLKKQYKTFDEKGISTAIIEQLSDENTFTVTTAHQPSLFLGPLYFI